MPDPADLKDGENWTGGFYELALQMGKRDDARLAAALGTGWVTAGVEGCWARGVRRAGRWSLHPAELSVAALERGHLIGVVTLPTGERTAWGTVAVREDDGDDWLDFYLPVGSLERALSSVGAFPFDDEGRSLDWRRSIDDWFARIARSVFVVAPFRLGLIGFEVSGTASADGLEIGDERWIGYLVPDGEGLAYHPATVGTAGAIDDVAT